MTTREPLRAVIVDDEPLARQGVRQQLERHAEVTVVGEAGDGEAAIAVIEGTAPDLVFLDIEMPGLSGLEVVRCLEMPALPLVIFVTAYDQYAVEAFGACALDYLLKPIDPERFDATLARVRERVGGEMAPDLRGLSADIGRRGRRPRLVIREGGNLKIVPVAEIEWVEAADNYVVLHTEGGRHLWRRSLSGVEEELAGCGFVRAHRSSLVRVEAVRELRSGERGDFVLVLASGVQVKGSRRFRDGVVEALGGEHG